MSFQQGISGLMASAKRLDITGNNIANASTVGYKRSTAQFADVYAKGLTNAAGLGVADPLNVQNFSQGAVTSTDNPLDIAISGNGFFKMGKPDPRNANAPMNYTYTRNGQFHISKEGFVENATGLRLQGVSFMNSDGSSNGISTTNANTAPVSSLVIPGRVPGSKVTSQVKLAVQLDANAKTPTPALSAGGVPTANNYNASTGVSVYDSLGNSHQLQLYFVKDATPANQWSVFGTLDGKDAAGTGSGVVDFGKLAFDENGNLQRDTATGLVDTTKSTALDPATFAAAATGGFTLSNGAAAMFNTGGTTLALDLTGSTQLALPSSQITVSQDGVGPGELNDVSVNEYGVISGKYSNGDIREIGIIKFTDFRNPNGLQPIGDNQFTTTMAAGDPIENFAGAGGIGTVQGKAIEESNVDLTKELVDLIQAQRLYQANSQTISAQSQILQTAVNLR